MSQSLARPWHASERSARWIAGLARLLRGSRQQDGRRCFLVLLAVLAGPLLLVPPSGAFAVDDDWAYAQAVQQLLTDGVYRPSVWIDTSFFAQAWWGAAASTLLGFSYTSLRLSTLLLAAVALVLSYTLLCRALRPALALLTTLLLLFQPLVFHLSYTFMTDVPFLAVVLAAIWCISTALPGLLAVCVSTIRGRRLAVPLLAAGVLAFDGWSVSWQREYMQRQAAVWRLAETIGAGFEWNGTYRSEAVIPEARDAAIQAGDPRQFVQRVIDGLYRPRRWYVDFTPPTTACPEQQVIQAQYNAGWPIYGVRRCFGPTNSRQWAGSSYAYRPPLTGGGATPSARRNSRTCRARQRRAASTTSR